MFMSSSKNKFTLLEQNSVTDLSVGFRPPCWCSSGWAQHGVYIQISIKFAKTFPRISRIRNIPLTWILARVFAYFPPFISQILDFIYWTVLILILIYFEWRGTENQQLKISLNTDQGVLNIQLTLTDLLLWICLHKGFLSEVSHF